MRTSRLNHRCGLLPRSIRMAVLLREKYSAVYRGLSGRLECVRNRHWEDQHGDELISINRAFLYAGASSVISTLWKVSDESTYLFMDDFYTHLKSQPVGEAMRTAQLDLINKYPHPFYWSPFILSGATNW